MLHPVFLTSCFALTESSTRLYGMTCVQVRTTISENLLMVFKRSTDVHLLRLLPRRWPRAEVSRTHRFSSSADPSLTPRLVLLGLVHLVRSADCPPFHVPSLLTVIRLGALVHIGTHTDPHSRILDSLHIALGASLLRCSTTTPRSHSVF